MAGAHFYRQLTSSSSRAPSSSRQETAAAPTGTQKDNLEQQQMYCTDSTSHRDHSQLRAALAEAFSLQGEGSKQSPREEILHQEHVL